MSGLLVLVRDYFVSLAWLSQQHHLEKRDDVISWPWNLYILLIVCFPCVPGTQDAGPLRHTYSRKENYPSNTNSRCVELGNVNATNRKSSPIGQQSVFSTSWCIRTFMYGWHLLWLRHGRVVPMDAAAQKVPHRFSPQREYLHNWCPTWSASERTCI